MTNQNRRFINLSRKVPFTYISHVLRAHQLLIHFLYMNDLETLTSKCKVRIVKQDHH